MTTSTDNLAEFIAAETRENLKAARLTWIVGLVIMALVTCYMSGLLLLLRSMLDPQISANMIRQQVEGQAVPALLSSLEDSLKAQAPTVANALSKGIMSSFRALRAEAEDQIKVTHHQLLPLMKEEIRTQITGYVAENEAELKQIYTDQKVEGFSKIYIDHLTKQLTTDIEAHIAQQSNLDGLQGVEAKTLAYLEDVQGGLDSVMSKPDAELSRSERLQRRLIVAWLRIFEDKLADKGL